MIGSPAPQETRDAGRPSSSPRFTGPEQARKRMRLLIALGMLVVAAVATATVANLSAERPSAKRRAKKAIPRPQAPNSATRERLGPALVVEARVEQAESALAGARAAIRSARQLGVVDPQQLSDFQRRLESATEPAQPPITDELDRPSEARDKPRRPVDRSPRDL